MNPDRREPFIKLAGNRAAGPFFFMLIMAFSLFYSTGAYSCNQTHYPFWYRTGETKTGFDTRMIHCDGSLCIVATLGINR